MTDELIGAVGKKLLDCFDGKFGVYTEKIPQGLEKDCFFLDVEKTEKKNLLGGRFFLRVTLCVKIVCDGDDENYIKQSITPSLFSALNFVEVGGVKLFGRNIVCEKGSGVTKVFACYDIFPTVEAESGDMMEKIEVREEFDGLYKGGA